MLLSPLPLQLLAQRLHYPLPRTIMIALVLPLAVP